MKKRVRLTESQLHQVIKESVEQILRESAKNAINEGWFGNVFNKNTNKTQQSTQNQEVRLPDGVYRSFKAAAFGDTHSQYIRMYKISTNASTLWCQYNDNVDIKQIEQQLKNMGFKVFDCEFVRYENPNWNGANYNAKVEPRYGYGDNQGHNDMDFYERGRWLR